MTDAVDFVVAIDADDDVLVGCDNGGKVRVSDDSVPTSYTTDCAAVTSLTVSATGAFANDINIDAVNFLFSSLGDGDVTVAGGGGNDSIRGSEFGDTLQGGTGNDELIGLLGNDRSEGGGDLDTAVDTGGGNDTMLGGPGGDVYFLRPTNSAQSDVVVELAGEGTNDRLNFADILSDDPVTADLSTGGTAIASHRNRTVSVDSPGQAAYLEVVQGGSGNDRLIGHDGYNELYGWFGNDTLTGGGGSDIFFDDAGVDRLQEVGDADIVLTDTALTGLGGEAFPSSTFEEAALTGGPGANLIDATAFSGPTTLDGAGGKDTVLGGADPDALTGGTGDDSLDGSGGLDRLAEAADVDLTLGPGSLTGLGTDVLGSIEEADLSGGAGPNALNAAAFDGPVTLGGGGGDDTLTAGPGDDTLDGEGGTDLLKEAGDASFTLTDAALTGGSVDALSGLERAFLTGGPGNNSLDTSAFTGSVTLDGAEGNDTLVAGPAADSILGRAGNDRMTGGKGPDRLLGHAGNDRFKARDGVKDLIKGGGGNKDSARTDRKDKVRGVEQRR